MRKSLIIRENRRRAHVVRKIIFYAVVVALVLAFSLFCRFVPLKTLLPAYGFTARSEGELRVHFVSVGEGDCSIIEYPDGSALLIDAGDGSFENANKLVRYLKGLAPRSLAAVVTHLDRDHCGGMADVLSYFRVQKLYLPVVGTEEPAYHGLRTLAHKRGTQVETLSRYGVLEHASGAYGVCVSPYSQEEDDENDASAVIYFSYTGVGFLFAGDISAAREMRLINDYALIDGIFDSKGYRVRLEDTDILKVSHHGSGSASSEEWLNLLAPRDAVICCGKGNAYRHPEAEVVERLAAAQITAWRSDELGDIIVSVQNGQYRIFARE